MGARCQALFRGGNRENCPIGCSVPLGTAPHCTRAPSGSGCPGPFVQPSRNPGLCSRVPAEVGNCSRVPAEVGRGDKKPFSATPKGFLDYIPIGSFFSVFQKSTPRAKRACCHHLVKLWEHGHAASILRHFLTTGEWVKRVPAPVRYRARVRTPEGLMHLGYFATQEERNAAIFAYRLGIFPMGQKVLDTVHPLG